MFKNISRSTKILNHQIVESIRTVAVTAANKSVNPSNSNKKYFHNSNAISQSNVRIFNREVSAAVNLVSRSFGIPKPILMRSLHTTCRKLQQEGKSGNDQGPGSGKKPDKDEKDKGRKKCIFHTKLTVQMSSLNSSPSPFLWWQICELNFKKVHWNFESI